jgi:hypothetical protein
MNHLYRWKLDTHGKALLQVLIIKENNTVLDSYNLFEISRDGSCGGKTMYVSYWKDGNRMMCCGIDKKAEYILSARYAQYFA